MSEYKTYPKIHRLGKEETDNILDNEVIVQEKVDGANVSIFWQDGKVRCGTRTRILPDDGSDDFRGFPKAVEANEEIKKLLEEYPHYILYGEWLVKHTITYPDAAYQKIYLFDIYNKETDTWLKQEYVQDIAYNLSLEYPHIFAKGKLTFEEIKEFVGKSAIAPAGEGVVLKAEDFINQFGDHVYAKVVHEKFKESNAIVFGGNNKHSETYWEMYVVNKYCTVGRVEKIMQKQQSQTSERLDMKHTSQIAGTCYHDLITEEAWEIVKKAPALNFQKLQGLCMKKFIQIYHDILNNSLSVADLRESETKNEDGT